MSVYDEVGSTSRSSMGGTKATKSDDTAVLTYISSPDVYFSLMVLSKEFYERKLSYLCVFGTYGLQRDLRVGSIKIINRLDSKIYN